MEKAKYMTSQIDGDLKAFNALPPLERMRLNHLRDRNISATHKFHFSNRSKIKRAKPSKPKQYTIVKVPNAAGSYSITKVPVNPSSIDSKP